MGSALYSPFKGLYKTVHSLLKGPTWPHVSHSKANNGWISEIFNLKTLISESYGFSSTGFSDFCQIFGQVFDQVFGQVFDQGFDQVVDKIFDQVFD